MRAVGESAASAQGAEAVAELEVDVADATVVGGHRDDHDGNDSDKKIGEIIMMTSTAMAAKAMVMKA